MSRTETRACPQCGRPFTWTSRFANRRFCDSRCKAAWWREAKNARRRQLRAERKAAPPPPGGDTPAATVAIVTHDAPAAPAPVAPADGVSLDALGDRVDPVRAMGPPGPGRQPAASVHSCPHCRNPVAVINLLVTPAAAYVNMPSRSVT